jgi:hypothetical protein
VGLVNRIVTVSPTLNPGTRGGGLDALADSTPGQHAAAPSRLPSGTRAPGNTSQGRQEALEGAPGWVLYLPLGHGVHDVCPGPL